MNTYPEYDPMLTEDEVEDFMDSQAYAGHMDEEDPGKDASPRSTAAGNERYKRAEEFAFIMFLLLLKVSLFFVLQYCEDKGYNTNLIEIIQF